jgi:hypothetical protein
MHRTIAIVVDDEAIATKTTRLRWRDLIEVKVAAVPARDVAGLDVVFVLLDAAGRRCVAPCGASGLLGRLLRLPRFDSEAVVDMLHAESSTERTCWSVALERVNVA